MNIAVLHPQCRVKGGAIKMALFTTQSLQNQGHNVKFYTFDHDDECFPELQKGLTIVTVKTTKRSKMKNEGGNTMNNEQGIMNNEGNQPANNQLNQSTEDKIRGKGAVDTLVKLPSFWSLFRTIFPGLFPLVSVAWDIRHVDMVIANNPPMQFVGVLARFFSLFSHFHQRLYVVWWHHHIPWYYVPPSHDHHAKHWLSLFSVIAWKSWFERYWIIPRIHTHVATSFYTAFCIEKYCGKKARVIHPVMIMTVEDLLRTPARHSRAPTRESRTHTHTNNNEQISLPGSSDLRFAPSENDEKKGFAASEDDKQFPSFSGLTRESRTNNISIENKEEISLPGSSDLRFAPSEDDEKREFAPSEDDEKKGFTPSRDDSKEGFAPSENDKQFPSFSGLTRESRTGIPSKDDEKVRPVALFSHGRLEPGKGFDTLVKLWKELQRMNNEKGIMNNGGGDSMNNDKLIMKNAGIPLIIAGDGSMKTWLQEQGATVIPFREGLLNDLAKTDTDILALYLSTIDSFGITPLEAQIAGLETIILDRGGARETVLLDSYKRPLAQLVAQESEILPMITNFIQQRMLQERVTNVNFCHHKEYFSVSRLDADILSLIESMG